MRFREFMPEEFLQVNENSDADDMAVTIITVLDELVHERTKQQASPKISTASFIALVQNTGYTDFNYDDLVSANLLPAVKNFIKSFNKDTITLNISTMIDNTNDKQSNNSNPDSASTVASMAKHARKSK